MYTKLFVPSLADENVQFSCSKSEVSNFYLYLLENEYSTNMLKVGPSKRTCIQEAVGMQGRHISYWKSDIVVPVHKFYVTAKPSRPVFLCILHFSTI